MLLKHTKQKLSWAYFHKNTVKE